MLLRGIRDKPNVAKISGVVSWGLLYTIASSKCISLSRCTRDIKAQLQGFNIVYAKFNLWLEQVLRLLLCLCVDQFEASNLLSPLPPPRHLNFWKFSPRKIDKIWFQPKCNGIRCIYQTLLWCLNSWLNQRSARSMARNFFSHGLEYFKNWCNLHLFCISRYLQFDTEKGRNYNMPTSPRGLRHTLGV